MNIKLIIGRINGHSLLPTPHGLDGLCLGNSGEKAVGWDTHAGLLRQGRTQEEVNWKPVKLQADEKLGITGGTKNL